MFYLYNLIILVTYCAILCFRQVRQESQSSLDLSAVDPPSQEARKEASKFIKLYLIVYVLVWGADWLQGPYLFTLYKDEKGFPESIVALFFVSGFIAAGVSGLGVGTLADRVGRKRICLLFCGTYTLSCLTTNLCNSPIYLLLGRVLGGLSTSILYSAFESWMVTEWTLRSLAGSGITLSYLFGILTQANSLTAIVAGVVSEWLVGKTGTVGSPFLAACALLPLAACIIMMTWSENHGDVSESSPWVDTINAIMGFKKDRRILSLSIASCVFEGSMYLFVFYWTPSLQDARRLVTSSTPATSSTLPYGLIFACFMASMMLGSLLFNHIMRTKYLTQAKLLVYVFILSSLIFIVNIVFAAHEWVVFWGWCVLEACVGMYYPCMGYLKGTIVEDGQRAATYALMRIPLNIFVVGVLGSGVTGTAEVDTGLGWSYRSHVFSVCAALLTAGAWVIARFIKSD